MRAFFLLLVLLMPLSAFAEWYEATGQAMVKNGDIQGARTRAIEDAVKQALLFSGASVTGIQEIANGVLTQDQLKLRSQGEVQNVVVLDEQRRDNLLNMTLRLEIFAEQQECRAAEFNKQLAITQSQLVHPEQARYGQIFDIHRAFSEQLYGRLQNTAINFSAIPYFSQPLDVSPFFSRQFEYDQRLLEHIREQSNSQYVLLSQIRDVSTGEQLNSDYAFWQDDHFKRYFAVDFALFDGMTFEKLWQQSYRGEGEWPHKKTDLVDVFSATFWQTQYGDEIGRIIDKVGLDLNAQLRCLPTLGIIQHVEGNKVVINLGRDNGLSKGQLLTLAHRSHFSDYAQSRSPYYITSLRKVRIEQLHQHSAIAHSLDDEPLGNIQLNDIVRLEKEDSF